MNLNISQNVPEFSITEPLNSSQNIQAVEHAMKCKIPPIPQPPFTTNLSALAQLAHAGLMLAIAQRSSVVPMYHESSESQSKKSPGLEFTWQIHWPLYCTDYWLYIVNSLLSLQIMVIPTATESAIKYKLCNSAEVILMHLSKCADKGNSVCPTLRVWTKSRLNNSRFLNFVSTSFWVLNCSLRRRSLLWNRDRGQFPKVALHYRTGETVGCYDC